MSSDPILQFSVSFIYAHTPPLLPKKMAPSGLERVVSDTKSLLCRGQIFYHSFAAPLKSELALHSIAPSSWFEKNPPVDYRPLSQDSSSLTPPRHRVSRPSHVVGNRQRGERVSGFKQFNSKVSSGREPQPILRGWGCEWVFMHFHQQWYHSRGMQFRLV